MVMQTTGSMSLLGLYFAITVLCVLATLAVMLGV
jgi:hypothetical protein